jgi:hypothetical protein
MALREVDAHLLDALNKAGTILPGATTGDTRAATSAAKRKCIIDDRTLLRQLQFGDHLCLHPGLVIVVHPILKQPLI